jgi:hypothetical protein
VDSALAERLRAADVVVIVRVAPVDDRVIGGEQRRELFEGGVDEGGWHHDPDRARRLQLGDQLGE